MAFHLISTLFVCSLNKVMLAPIQKPLIIASLALFRCGAISMTQFVVPTWSVIHGTKVVSIYT